MRLSFTHLFTIGAFVLAFGNCLPQSAPGLRLVGNGTARASFQKRGAPGEVSGTVVYKRIDVSGIHAWQPPSATDKRGPCPALNALANHGYLPRNGILNMLTAPGILNDVLGLGLDLGLLLSVYATLLSGDPLTISWSIGGAHPGLLSPLLGGGQGLSGSHNKYETDASVTHGDYYLHNGDVESVQLYKFKKLLSLQTGKPDPNFDLDAMAQHRKFSLEDSISKNPEFFFGPFSGLLVSNAGHCFVPGMFSNFTEDHPKGKLTKEILMPFFAVSRNPDTGDLTHKKGWERIPDNWYRRPPGGLLGDYGLVKFAEDLVYMALKVPQIVKVGGNTGKVNSFVGVDLSDLTGGIYKAVDLLNPAKLLCFVFRLLLVAVPDILRGGLLGGILKTALNLLTMILVPLFDPKCPGIQQWDSDKLSRFPGVKDKAL